jgi:LacI family transcriptional regulator
MHRINAGPQGQGPRPNYPVHPVHPCLKSSFEMPTALRWGFTQPTAARSSVGLSCRIGNIAANIRKNRLELSLTPFVNLHTIISTLVLSTGNTLSIERVAKYAGVSTATVSRVLNEIPTVSESTVRAVREALKAVNYDPLAVKRGPKPGMRRSDPARKVKMIAVMTVGVGRDKPPAPATGSVVSAISFAAKQKRIKVLLDEMPDLAEMSDLIENREVDGAVVFLADDAPLEVLERMRQHVPIVWAMGGQAGALPVDHVSENNTAIGYLAWDYLHKRGCREMTFLSMLPHKRNARQRGQGLLGAAADTHQQASAFLMTQDPIIAGTYGSRVTIAADLPALIEAFAKTSPRPDGLFIDRDATTMRVYPLLQRFGIEPGKDVTIVSCDNEEATLSALTPRPASIDLGTEELGGRILRRLILRIENRDEPPLMIQSTPRLVLGDD